MVSTMMEDVPLNPDTQEISPNASTANNPSVTSQALDQTSHVTIITAPIPLQCSVSVFPEPPLGFNSRGAPPSYEEAIDPNAPPPSYESLFGRVRQAHKSRKGIFDFLQNVLVLLLGTIGCTIILAISFALPISMTVIGGIYLYDCPQEEYIPVYLLVGGGFGILRELLNFAARVHYCGDEERVRQSSTLILINCFFFCFLLGWFILGSMWVYKEYEPNYDPTLGKYCNKTLYLFAFWVITSGYVLIALIVVCVCSFTMASILFTK